MGGERMEERKKQSKELEAPILPFVSAKQHSRGRHFEDLVFYAPGSYIFSLLTERREEEEETRICTRRV